MLDKIIRQKEQEEDKSSYVLTPKRGRCSLAGIGAKPVGILPHLLISDLLHSQSIIIFT